MQKILDLSACDYHAKRAFSYSVAKRILENPNKWALGVEQKRTTALDFGSLAHDLVLSPAEIDKKYLFAEFDKLDMRLKDCKEAKADADSRGLILVDKVTLATAQDCISANKAILDKYLTDGACEVSFVGEMQGVECKCRADFLKNDNSLIVDLKFVADATKDGFTQAIARYGYYIQNALYCDMIGAKRFLFIAIEKEAPFLCGIYEISPESVEFGREKYLKALEMYKNADLYRTQNYAEVDLGFGTQSEIQSVTLPTWAFYKD